MTLAFRLQPATEQDLPVVLQFIRELADYEKLGDQVTATESDLYETLFGPERVAYAVLAYAGAEPAGFAVYFISFSTFLARPGLYLEDLYVRPEWRRQGLGRKLLAHLAHIAIDRGFGRMEWSVLDWNEMALRVYRGVGATAMNDWTIQRLTGEPLKALAKSA
ncbi:MAG: GNAT family N-acetyltransferase [Luteitalea sp.]|nr:GNAT family N-acetyltransferase [Luteitalea sp.]